MKISVVLVLLLAWSSITRSQERLDTLMVSPGSTTYAAFPADITLVDIGNKDYAFKVEKNILLLKSDLPAGKGTNMLVRFGNDLFTGWLIHTGLSHRSLYDYRTWSMNKGRVMPVMLVKADTSAVSPIIQHLDEIQKMDDKFRTLGIVRHSLAFLLVNLMTDSSYMYLRFRILNKSNLAYNLDYVSFDCRRNGQSSGKTNLKILQPVYVPRLRKILPHANVLVTYVIPSYAPGEGGSLEVTFRESEGNRRALLSIPARLVSTAETFKDTIR